VYLPSHFAEERLPVLHALMQSHPLSTLVVSAQGQLEANPVPLLLDATRGAQGTLVGHVARGNPLWRHIEAGTDAQLGALAIFHGPQAYVTPNWYPAKQADGKVVPTWNYIVVHAHGRLRTIHDPQWLLALVTRLTDVNEAGEAAPWRVTDAPASYIQQMLRAIVGIELPITRLEGKWKVSQNRSVADRRGVAAGLQAGERAGAESQQMAAAVSARTGD
jgi:transcriptional regulator